jgi:hypothetical protein
MIKDVFIEARFELPGPKGCPGGIAVKWRASKGEALQIVTNFSNVNIPAPALLEGRVYGHRPGRAAPKK